MAYIPTNYRDNDPSTPLSAANLNNTERGVKTAHDQISALRAEIRDLPTGGLDESAVRMLIDDVLSDKPLPTGWVFSSTGQPPAEGTFTDGTFCFTMESGRVFRRENNQWVYKGFIATAVQDQAIAHQVLSGKYTQAALNEVSGVSIPFMDDYGQARLQFAGRDWVARDSSWKSGGPQANDTWSRTNVTVTDNKAVLRISPKTDVTSGETYGPAGAELVSVNHMGYGTYEVRFTADFSQFDKWATFGLFMFDWDDDVPGHGEIDLVEIGKWGKTDLAAKLTHYPTDDPVHSPEFAWPPSLTKGIVRMAWEPGRITWTLIDGNSRETLHTATTTDRVPVPRRQKLHMNLWVFNAAGWDAAKAASVTIDGFTFIKQSTNNVAGLDAAEVDRRINQAVATAGQSTDQKITEAKQQIEQATGQQIKDALQNQPKLGASSMFDRIYQPGRRYLSVPTYWWADSDYNADTNWRFIFRNLDIVPFVLMNPHSGVGDKVEQDFVRHLKRLKSLNIPSMVYVRTVTDLANRVMRPSVDIVNEVAKYVEFYGRENIGGVFLDEVYNGWDLKYEAQQQVYLDIFKKLRDTYGEDFLIVVNPGSPTTNYLVDAVDVIMCFEHNPTRFLGELQGLNPDWYKNLNPGKLWVVVHDITSEEQARKVLAELEKLNVANVYLTTDTFNGVIGGENENNNPWDNLPAQWLQDLQTDWMRHTMQPESVRSYSGADTTSGIKVVKSAEEAAQLPLGTIYAIVASKQPTVVAHTGGNVNSKSFTVTIPGAQTGDKVVIAVNTKGVVSMILTPSEGLLSDVTGYWAGTQRSWLFTGPYKDGMTITSNVDAEFGWAAVAVRDAGTIQVGSVLNRADNNENADTVTTSPALEAGANDLVLGFAFERTSAAETEDQVTVSEGWEKLHFTPQSTNYQTVLVAKGGTGAMKTTYPNAQQLNGAGVQVVCRA